MLPMILLWCSSLGAEVQDTPIQPGDEGFYTLHSYHLHAVSDGNVNPSVLEMLREFGQFAEMEVGETPELAALRLGLDHERLLLLNPGMEEHPRTVLCLELRHRCLPGETLDQIAPLYDTEVDVLRRLNELPAPQEPARWSKVVVPAKMTGTPPGLILHLPMPHWDWARRKQPELIFRNAIWTHRVVEGDTWQSLAELAGCPEDVLRRVNALEPEGDGLVILGERERRLDAEPGGPPARPELGSTVTLGWKHLVDPERDLEATVLFLESFLRVDLDRVLEINEIDRPEWMLAKETLKVPFSGWAGFRGIRLQPSGSSFQHPPGLDMDLNFGNHRGGRTFDLYVSDTSR